MLEVNRKVKRLKQLSGITVCQWKMTFKPDFVLNGIEKPVIRRIKDVGICIMLTQRCRKMFASKQCDKISFEILSYIF